MLVALLQAPPTPAAAGEIGDLDQSFGFAGKGTVFFDLGGDYFDGAGAVVVRPNGVLVLGGGAQASSFGYDWAFAQLEPNGQLLDPSFGSLGKAIVPWNLGGDGDDSFSSMALQPDGKLVAVGTVDRGTHADVGVVRLDAGGSPDPIFGVSGLMTVGLTLGETPLRESGYDVVLQPDGKIVVVGIVSIGSNDDFLVIRLDAGGSPDSTFSDDGITTVPFDLGTGGADQAYAVALQPDGKMVVGGRACHLFFTMCDFAVARLLAGGTLDNSFGTGGKQTVAFDLGGEDFLADLTLQPDGKILLFGSADHAFSERDFAVARLTAGGDLDPSFGVSGRQTVAFDLLPSHPDDIGTALLLQPDGKILLAGSVTTALNTEEFGLARLDGLGSLDTSFGTGGRRLVAFDLVADGSDAALALALQRNGRIVVAGWAQSTLGPLDYDFAFAGLHSGIVFFGGFESGDATAWSSTTP